MDFLPSTAVILSRLHDIEMNISLLREFLTKYPDISFYKVAKKVLDKNQHNNVYDESLDLVVTLDKIIEIFKKYEEVKEFL